MTVCANLVASEMPIVQIFLFVSLAYVKLAASVTLTALKECCVIPKRLTCATWLAVLELIAQPLFLISALLESANLVAQLILTVSQVKLVMPQTNVN